MAKKDKIIQPYVNVPYLPLNEVDNTKRNGAQFFRNVKELTVGYGAEVFRVDRNGMWAGAKTFATAPWSVDWNGNMVAASITLSGYIPTAGALNDIGLGGITAGYINVSSLSAISANIGSVTSGTVTGALVRTSSSGARVQMNNTTNALEVFDSSGVKRVLLDLDEVSFFNASSVDLGGIYADTTNLTFEANNGNFLLFKTASLYGMDFRCGTTQIMTVTTAGVTVVNGNLLAGDATTDIGNSTQGFRNHFFEDVTSNPTTDGQMVYYNNAGQGLRMQFGGSDFQFDATAV